ncbi:MAG: S-layer homology domain-containing protein [Bacillota bacterium]
MRLRLCGLAVAIILAVVPAASATVSDRSFDLAAYGILRGDAYGNLRLNDRVTRAEMAAILCRLSGWDYSASVAAPFTDISPSHWASGYISHASQQGWIKGYVDGRFQPETAVSHAQALTMLVRLLGYEDRASRSAWPTGYLNVAGQLGLTTGLRFELNAAATRGEIVEYSYRAFFQATMPDGLKLVDRMMATRVTEVEVEGLRQHLRVGDSIRLTATARDVAGDTVQARPIWSASANLQIDTEGNLTAKALGEGWVTVSVGSVTHTFSVLVAGEAVRLVMQSASQELVANGKASAELIITAVDSAGRRTPTSGLTVILSSSDPTRLRVDRSIVVLSDGLGQATAIAGTGAGAAIITATSPGLMPATASIALRTPSPVSINLEVDSEQMSAKPGSYQSLRVYLTDESGQAVPNTTGRGLIIKLTSSNPQTITVSHPELTIGHGQSEARALIMAGGQIGDALIRATSPTHRLAPAQIPVSARAIGPSTRLAMAVTGQPANADGHAAVTVRVMVQDEAGNLVSDQSGLPITLIETSGRAEIIQPTVLTSGGLAAFAVRSRSAGTLTLVATATGNGIAPAQGNVTFTPGPPVAVQLSAGPLATVAADGQTGVVLEARLVDVNGNRVEQDGVIVTFRRVGTQGSFTLPTEMAAETRHGVARIRIIAGTKPGADSFVAQAPLMLTSNSCTVTSVKTGEPYQLAVDVPGRGVVGEPLSISVRVLDKDGQQVTSANGLKVYLLSQGRLATASPQLTHYGAATFQVTTIEAGTTGFWVSLPELWLQTSVQQVFFGPGEPARIVLVADADLLPADGVSRVRVKARAEDRYGNPVQHGECVDISLIGNAATLSSAQLFPGGSVEVSSTGNQGIVQIVGSHPTLPVQGLQLSAHPVGEPVAAVLITPDSIRAGEETLIRVRLLDANGRLATNYSTGDRLSAALVRIDGTDPHRTITVGSVHGLAPSLVDGHSGGTADILNGEAVLRLKPSKVGSLTLSPTVYYRGSPLASVPVEVVVRPGYPSRLVVFAPEVKEKNTQPFRLEVQITDSLGNPVTAANDTVSIVPSHPDLATILSPLTVNTVDGWAEFIIMPKKEAAGGLAFFTIKGRYMPTGTTTMVIIDQAPGQPHVIATDHHGSNAAIDPGEHARLEITVEPRLYDQMVEARVDSVVVPTYISLSQATPYSRLSAGQSRIILYVRREDLGSPGSKSITVRLRSPIGEGMESRPVSLQIKD